jgi:hypothetical protein
LPPTPSAAAPEKFTLSLYIYKTNRHRTRTNKKFTIRKLLNQCCGSELVSFFVNADPDTDPDPDPGFGQPKIGQNLQPKKILYSCNQKLPFTYL